MNPEPIELTPEQEFLIIAFEIQVNDLDRESAIALPKKIYRQAFVQEIKSRQILGELILNRQWTTG